MIILLANLTHVLYSTFAIASPPIITPDVGVIRFTSPQPAPRVDIINSDGNPKLFANGPNIGIDTLAKPDVEGIKNDKPIYIKNAMFINNIGDIPLNACDALLRT